MSKFYDKDKLKEELNPDNIYSLLEEWGGEPEMFNNYIISTTICHNLPGEGSRKLYYYYGTRLCHCYSGCADNPSFDIFQLCIKIMKLQYNLDWELYQAMDYIAGYFGIDGVEREENNELEDWSLFKRYNFIDSYKKAKELKTYDESLLYRFPYIRIESWEREGIKPEISKEAMIRYYPGKEQIVIPHYDIDNRLIGIRGRSLSEEEAKRYGKYRPLVVGKKMYNHPLSMNLYNINNSKDNIRKARVAIVLESEKSCLQYASYYGRENDISVGICGSNLSFYQVDILRSLGVQEIVLAFDRQFQEIGDEEFIRLKNKLIYLYSRYNKLIHVTAIFDKHLLTPYKASPTDTGKKNFEKLLQERIIPKE